MSPAAAHSRDQWLIRATRAAFTEMAGMNSGKFI
jgi:hypothetical protein